MEFITFTKKAEAKKLRKFFLVSNPSSLCCHVRSEPKDQRAFSPTQGSAGVWPVSPQEGEWGGAFFWTLPQPEPNNPFGEFSLIGKITLHSSCDHSHCSSFLPLRVSHFSEETRIRESPGTERPVCRVLLDSGPPGVGKGGRERRSNPDLEAPCRGQAAGPGCRFQAQLKHSCRCQF